ncbi:MAG: alpha/beta hydrolase [Pseudomonadota bacterium]|nr:alpha/beta hydrolase [Pseudomonadota bacterium]
MVFEGLKSLLLVLAVAYLVLLIAACTMQSRMLYLPHVGGRTIVATPADIGLQFDEVELVAADGVRLHGWFVPHPQPRATLLFFHGNAGNISHRQDSLRVFHELRLSILIFDYRGYGRSDGAPLESGTRRDADAAWRYLTGERQISDADIVLFGRSLGAAVAAELATRERPGALILESAFTSVPELASDLYPLLPARWLTRFAYDTLASLRQVRCPVLVVHSTDDEIIPYAHGETLYETAAPPKELLQLRGGHNDGFLLSREHYVAGLDAFLEGAGLAGVTGDTH